MNIIAIVVPSFFLLGYLGILIAMLVQRRVERKTERALALYLALLAVWNVPIALSLGAPPGTPLSTIGSQIVVGELVLLGMAFLNLAQQLLQNPSRLTTLWWAWGVLYAIAFAMLTLQVIPVNLIDISRGNFKASLGQIAQAISVLIWSGFILTAIVSIWRAYCQTSSPLHRNRYHYMILASLLLVVGNALFASPRTSLPKLFGLGAQFASALFLVLVTLRHTLLGIKTLYRHAFSYITSTLLTISIGFGLLYALTTFVKWQWIDGALLGIVAVSLFLSFANVPIRRATQKLIDRKVFGVESADYNVALRAYGEKVIETLRLEPLADLVVNTLIHAVGIDHAGLYLVREGEQEVGGTLLDPIKRVGDLPEDHFELLPDSALVRRLKESDEPISQYDIDLHDEFAAIPASERLWLRSLAVELWLPIHTSTQLVGVLTLGAKASGEVYTAEEISWLKALSDQTGVALQNARLFDQVEGMSIRVMRLNADLEQAYQKLQEVDKLKSAFIGVITHELRSPFVSAGFSMQLLNRYVERKMYDQLPAQIQQLDRELAEGRKMIDQIISFSSLLSKQGELQSEETDLDQLIRETAEPLSKMAQSRNLTLSLHLSSQLPLLMVDKKRLGEAIYHTIHNAIKFNREGGSIRVACWSTQTHVIFKVEDTGVGIPADKLPTLWDAFTQAADGVRRGVEGLGIGLPLIKFVVEAHGGQVWASSEEGQGSTFGFRIPLAPGQLKGPALKSEGETSA